MTAPATLDIDHVSYSTRACRRCGTEMVHESTDAHGSRWRCPRCGHTSH